MSTFANSGKPVMDGFPPSVDSQVTKKNHRDWPYSQWAFRNFGAPNNVVMVPRAGELPTSSARRVSSMVLNSTGQRWEQSLRATQPMRSW